MGTSGQAIACCGISSCVVFIVTTTALRRSHNCLRIQTLWFPKGHRSTTNCTVPGVRQDTQGGEHLPVSFRISNFKVEHSPILSCVVRVKHRVVNYGCCK